MDIFRGLGIPGQPCRCAPLSPCSSGSASIELPCRLWHNDIHPRRWREILSTTLIVALVVGGLAIVIAIGFFSQAVERARLEKARAVAELHARWNHCNGINAALPGQFMSPDLRSEEHTSELQSRPHLVCRLLL